MKKILTLLIAAMVFTTGSYAQTAVTCAEAAALMPAEQNAQTDETYIVTGYVTNTNGTISPSRTDASIDQQTFWMDDAKGTTKTLQGYWCNLPGHEALNVGDLITVTGKIMNYNNTPEIKNGNVAILERVSITIDTIEVTVCQAIEEGGNLNVGDYSDDIFKVYGRVKGTDAVNNYGQHTFEMSCGNNIFKPYNCKGEDGLELGKGDSVVVIGKLYNYNGTIEISNGTIKLIEKNLNEVIHDVSVTEAIDIAMALPDGGITEDRYAVTGYVESIVTAYNEQYANITFLMTDDMSQKTAFHAYRVKVSAEEAETILPGAKVTVTATLQHYYRAATDELEELNFPETSAGGSFKLIESAIEDPGEPIVYPTDVPQIWPILMDETTFEANQYAVVSDFRTNDIDQFLYIWENTYYGLGATGKNFYGNSEGYLSLSVENLGWAGAGYCLTGYETGKGWQDAEKLRQAMVANPDEYFLHLAIKSTDNYSHCFYFFNNENTKFVLGSKSVYDGAVYGDFTRDGAWHEFYIPMSQFASGFADYPLQANTNVFVLLSESVQGAQLNLDAVYFCNRYAKEHNVPQAYDPDDDPSVNPGPYTIRVDDNSLDDWNNLPSSYVAQAFCPANATYQALKSVKVFADQRYINILIEPVMDELPDLEWVPFHVFFDTDNSQSTGGFADLFTDACVDVLLETAVFAESAPFNYNPAVYKWWGEVGGSGWQWTDPSVEHDASDFWGAIVGEGQLPIGNSQFVDGKIEIQLLRDLIPANWNMEEFGIGFDIEQNWSWVGTLPQVSPTDDNPSGHAKMLKVKVHPSTPGETPIVEKDVVINGIRYILDNANNTAHVTYKNDEPYSGAINIPAQITYNDVTYDVISIGEYAFANCYDLTAITIPNGVTVIGDGAFYACTGLTSIVFPNSVKYFGNQVIGECYNLITVYAPAALMNNYNNLERLETLVITGGELYQYALNYLPQSLKSLDLFAVTNTELPSWALNGRYNLQSLVLPQNLERIDYFAFAECIRLESIVIPASVTEIDARAFENCRSLQSVTFAGTALKSLGDWAFYNCHELSKIELPEGVESVGKAAFYGCAYLNEIVVPASVQAMGDNAFALCSRLQKITSNAVVPPTIAEKTFFEVSSETPVYVPEVSVAAYKADQFWGRLNIVGAETAVQNTTVDANAIRKQVINGQLLILRDGKTYTVQGQEIK